MCACRGCEKSAIYYYYIIEVRKGNDKKLWFYEGQDLFSGEDADLIKGSDLVNTLMKLSEDGYKIKATTKDGVVSTFKNIDDFLTCL